MFLSYYRTCEKIRAGLFKAHAVLGRSYFRKISKNAYFRAMLIQKNCKIFDATSHEVVRDLHFHHIGVKIMKISLELSCPPWIILTEKATIRVDKTQ